MNERSNSPAKNAPTDFVGAVRGVVERVGQARAGDQVGEEVEAAEVPAQAVDEEPDDPDDGDGGEEGDAKGLGEGAL